MKVYSKFQIPKTKLGLFCWVVLFFFPFLLFHLTVFLGISGKMVLVGWVYEPRKAADIGFEGLEKVGTFFWVRCLLWSGRWTDRNKVSKERERRRRGIENSFSHDGIWNTTPFWSLGLLLFGCFHNLVGILCAFSWWVERTGHIYPIQLGFASVGWLSKRLDFLSDLISIISFMIYQPESKYYSINMWSLSDKIWVSVYPLPYHRKDIHWN